MKLNGKSRFEAREQVSFYADPSFWSLIAANVIAVVWAVIDDWSLLVLIPIYWFQSLVIGLFWFLKICELKDFQVPGREDLSMEEAFRFRTNTAVAFMLAYLIFHAIPGALLLDPKLTSENMRSILIMAGIFFISHCLSFSKTSTWISAERPTQDIVSFPFVRIIPMYVPLMVAATGLGQKAPLVVFLVLKTWVDVAMHAVEHRHFSDRSHGEKTFKDFERRKRNEIPECEVCGREIEKHETPWVVKEHVVCQACHNRILFVLSWLAAIILNLTPLM
jgi:hypothetical protein